MFEKAREISKENSNFAHEPEGNEDLRFKYEYT